MSFFFFLWDSLTPCWKEFIPFIAVRDREKKRDRKKILNTSITEYLKTVGLARKCPKRTEGSTVDPECYWPFVPILWGSLSVASTHPGPLNLQECSSEENHHLQKRNLAIRNQVGSWGNKRWSLGLTPPSSIKHALQSHFTPQHLPAVPQRYTYSSLSKMFMERNYQQEKTNSLERYCPLWDNYFCGSTDNGDGVWLECGLSGRAGRCRSTKIPEQGDSATLEPAYLTRLKDTVTVKFLRLKGSGRRCPFLIEARKACSAPRPKDTRQNAVTEGSHSRPQPCLSCRPGGF